MPVVGVNATVESDLLGLRGLVGIPGRRVVGNGRVGLAERGILFLGKPLSRIPALKAVREAAPTPPMLAFDFSIGSTGITLR